LSPCEHEHPRWAYGGRGRGQPLDDAAPLQVVGLTSRYPGAARIALADVSFSVAAGQRVALVGPNGAGKSTILKTVAGLLRAECGEVRLYGNPVGACHHRTAYLPQRADLDWRFPITVAELVVTGRYVHLGWFRRPRASDWQRVRCCLQRLGIGDLADRQIADLSGGQQQRALLARAIVQEARLFLLDEPLNAVDEATRDLVTDVLAQEARTGASVLAATHDLGRLSESFDAAIYLRDGRIEQTDLLATARSAASLHRTPAPRFPANRIGDRSCTG
jgi:ABC-type Mn2+/Zn2+ transport system ATPase subunit